LWAHARRLRLAAEGAVSSPPSIRGGQRAQPPSQSDYYESAFDAVTRKIVTLCTVSPALAAAATIPPISPGCGGGGPGDVSAGAATPRVGFGAPLQPRPGERSVGLRARAAAPPGRACGGARGRRGYRSRLSSRS